VDFAQRKGKNIDGFSAGIYLLRDFRISCICLSSLRLKIRQVTQCEARDADYAPSEQNSR
jgi:hypothetical protein